MRKTDLARKYRDEYGMEMPTLKLARIMYKDNKLLFSGVEQARGVLRAIEGKLNSDAKVTHKIENRPLNPYNLPGSDETIYDPYIIKAKRILGLFDIHAPYHSIQAITSALTFARKEKPDAVLIGGDLFDFHGLSKFVKDPSKKNFADELRIGVELIHVIQKTLKCRVYYKFGNHCERYQHFLWTKSKELDGVEDFELKTIIKKRVPEIEVIDKKRIIKANDLNIVHGHEFASSVISPVNIARGLYLRAKASTVCGHHHRTSSHTEQDINGKIITTWSVGCLSELHPEYMPINSWNHGFCMIDLADNKKEVEVRNKIIYNGIII